MSSAGRLAAFDAQYRVGLKRAEPYVRRWIHPAMWALVTVPVVAMIAMYPLGMLGANPIRELEHFSGEWALRLLACSLAVTPLIKLTRWGWLIPERRFLGLAAFYWAILHLSVYIGLDMFFDVSDIVEDVLKHLYITVGMLAFVLMIPLALTSTKASIKRLGGRKWNALHSLVYVSAIAGCVHYLWGVKKDIEEPIMYSSVFVVLFAFRIVWKWGRRDARGTVRAASS